MAATRTPSLLEVVSEDLNWEVWSAMMKTTLTEKGLWEIVENGIPPDPTKIPEVAATLQVEELCRWRDLARKDMKALKILQSCLTDSVFKKTLSASSAKDLWDMLTQAPDSICDTVWMVYTNISSHMTSNDKYFTTLDRKRRGTVRFYDGSFVTVQGIGDVRFLTREDKMVTFKNVLYVPGIAKNVLSASEMTLRGFAVKIGPKRCTIREKGTNRLFGENKLEESGHCLRLQVIC